MPETHLDKFKKLLAELFMFDQADLDFGVYRIMNAKRDEITKFLDRDLLPQVREALGELEQADRAAIEAELMKAIEQARALGADAESLPKVKELRQQLAQKADIEAIESEVFSDLYSFFRRYYNEGDFLSLRRYKEGVYAIPYEGEEVKLYWANYDQYYIKTAEYFRNYTFTVASGRSVHFRLAEANTEQNNNQAANGEERRFNLREADPVMEENGELVIRFEYRPDAEKRKQAELNQQAARHIFEAGPARNWLADIAAKAPTEKSPDRTVLDKRLADYTARNTFDYFIHKDLRGFLRRELDFYIKNEIVHLDDIESEAASRVEQYLAKVKAVRRVARKIIDFLAQIEEFEKKLWLKKKFVVESRYCVALGQVPESFYPELAANEAQREEWVQLLALDQLAGDLMKPAYSVPLTPDFFKAYPSLMLDTAHFAPDFTSRLIATFSDIDDVTDGVLMQSENFQAISFLQSRYKEQVNCIYIDPPYNTDSSAILYKNDYKHSSWLSLVENRVSASVRLLHSDGILCLAIDDEEVCEARRMLSEIFRKLVGVAVVRSNPQSRKKKGKFSPVHEYALFFGSSEASTPGPLELTEKRLSRYPLEDENGRYAWMNFIRTGNNDLRGDRPKLFYPIYVTTEDKIRVPRMTWLEESGPYGEYSIHESPEPGEVVVYPKADADGQIIEKNWHRGPERVATEPGEFRVRRDGEGKVSIDFKTRIDEESAPTTWWDNKEYASANYGAAELKAMFGRNPFDFPKAVSLVTDCLRAAKAGPQTVILDFFVGSGTTGEAAVKLNREDGGRRKFLLVEMGAHFKNVLVPRMKKIAFAPEWKDGKPKRIANHEEVEQGPRVLKILRLESYEDTLNNIELTRTEAQGQLLSHAAGLREDYLLRYMLHVESNGSASLLNTGRFDDPFSYKLNIGNGSVGETRAVTVDLIETFNWLLGLRVKHVDAIRGFRVVHGTSPKGEKVLVIWRTTREKGNADLDDFFLKQGYNTRDMEFDVIYVNGDNNLENLKRPDETWKVRLIEEEFKRLMFDVRDTQNV
jgi:adenine-specific DNA-methyltransferase